MNAVARVPVPRRRGYGERVREVVRTALGLLVLMVVASVVPLVDGVRQARAVVWAASRGALQLLTVGLVLGAVFRAPLAVLPALAVMVAAATATVTPRLVELPVLGRWRRPAAAAVAVTSGAAVTGTVVFATGALAFGVRNLVAVGGITVGGAMTASTLAGRRFLAELRNRRAEVEGKLALGATMRQATADLVAVAVGEALVPALDQTRTTGLVTLPGAFVGALFGGASPLAAARFQLVVLVGLLAAESVAAVVLLRFLAAVPFLPTGTAAAGPRPGPGPAWIRRLPPGRHRR
jgi:putative ABC transport system permease protein